MSDDNKRPLAGEGFESAMAMVNGMVQAMSIRQAHALYAAHALQALIIANVRPGSMIDGGTIVGDAWRFADAMLQAQQAREEAAEEEAPQSLASVLAAGSA